MNVLNLDIAASEVLGAWRCIPEAERSLELLADVAVQVVLDTCVQVKPDEH